jgi:hypothetical protein
MNTRGRMYFLIYEGTMLVLSFDVSDFEGGSREQLDSEFKRREVLFDLMAQSLDIYNRYP